MSSYLTTRGIAKLLGCTIQGVIYEIHVGHLKAQRVGWEWHIPKPEFQAWRDQYPNSCLNQHGGGRPSRKHQREESHEQSNP